MSSGGRKLSFQGLAPQQATGVGEDEDEEMERTVWPPREGGDPPAPPAAAATPRRDRAAPPPYEDGEGAAPEGEGSPRHVRWDGAPPPDVAAVEHQRREERLEERALPHRALTRSLRESEEPGGEGGEEKEAGEEVDRSPHAVFVQLDELVGEGEGEGEGRGGVWRETARWIKYEEDVEEGSARWGRPHVASLSYRSLRNLRRCLETGAVVLDVAERDLPGAAWRVAQSLAAGGHIPEEAQQAVLGSLLLRHHRVHEHSFRFSIGSRKHSSHTSLQSLWQQHQQGGRPARASEGGPPPPAEPRPPRRRHSALPRISLAPAAAALRSLAETRRRRSSQALEARKRSSGALPDVERGSDDSREELHHRNDALMRRIPEDAEATAVLVGDVTYLDRPAVAFLRLAEAVPMPTVTEVPVPVRFLFVLLGPPDSELDHREVGRSISTLMSDRTFHSVAYRATDASDLLSAIDDFLDESIVLPPGDWERRALLSLEELRAKSEHIRRRKRDALVKLRATTSPPAAAPAPAPLGEKQALLAAESAPPSKEPDDPLSRTGRLFGGVVRDVRRRYPHYASDFSDALNGQCAAAAIFMYFAALSSAITFGGLLAEKTDGQIGISETLVFTSLGGVVFALAAGQPMMITGATGPLLLLDESLSGFCRSYGFDFLAARMYAGLWMIVIALAVASVEGSVAVKKITRFTEDIFAFLISLIFISEPITATLAVYRAHPLGADYCTDSTSLMPSNSTSPSENATSLSANVTSLLANATGDAALTGTGAWVSPAPQPNTALFCTILTLSTFVIAYFLRIFRNGKYLGRSARRALGDFGVPIAIVTMVALSCVVPVWTETLRVPEGLSPTAPRPWLVPLAGGLGTLPAWAVAAMSLPAFMVYIIVFMETHIAELIVDKPERKLQKGSGFHMDIVLMSMVNAVCGMFGAPWQCVATVRSVSHVAALTVMSSTHAPGDKPHIVQVMEQRVTGLVVALLVGVSVLAARWLRLVPMSVLFGVFLYMGISALAGIQLWDRAVLLFKPVKHHPPTPYVRRVPTLRMHTYTLVQMAGLVLLYAVKSSRFSLALPFFLVLMVPLRMTLAFYFTPMQLRALDGAQKEIDDDEPDFYQEAPLPG